MTGTEFWLAYQLASRSNQAPTTQLIELEFQNHKLFDLEDVLDYVFHQGYVEARYRPFTRWERKDAQKVKVSQPVEDLLKQGVGKTPENALKLVVDDMPTSFWFSYVYLHGHAASHPAVIQRVKLNEHPAKFERLAHITNYIFGQGFLAAKLRPVVHWEKACGARVEENVCVNILLMEGQATCEEKPLRLVIDAAPSCFLGCHCHRCTL
ncbi:hypothetical protein BYT27DRAFT_7176440 [Phlegmacium glaucopus]|nr:hypothetical protein BYT27DRAFT_7176440 [Phlegmacium glaucopus]